MESKTGTTRRDLLRAAGLGLTFPLLSACGGLADSGNKTKNQAKSTLKIGFVSPRTGAAAGFGEPDAYVLSLAKKSLTSLTGRITPSRSSTGTASRIRSDPLRWPTI